MKYFVSGICMVPTYAEMTVDAETPEQALALAQAAFSRDSSAVLVPGGADERSAYDWRPDAVPV